MAPRIKLLPGHWYRFFFQAVSLGIVALYHEMAAHLIYFSFNALVIRKTLEIDNFTFLLSLSPGLGRHGSSQLCFIHHV
jgi:hypothetical protein